MRKIALIVLFALANSLFAYSEETDDSKDEYKELIPEEYKEDEFHPVLRDIRRAEVILAGSYPFAIFFTKLGIGMYDYASSGFDSDNAPSVFGGKEKAARTSEETGQLLLYALCVSAAITSADYIIGKIKEKKELENKRNN